MRSLVLAFALVGCALALSVWGQTVDFHYNSPKVVRHLRTLCIEAVIQNGDYSILEAACLRPAPVTLAQIPDVLSEDASRYAHEVDDWRKCGADETVSWLDGHDGQWVCHPKSEPVDVPAIQESSKEPPDCRNMFDNTPMWRHGEYCSSEPPSRWTCADKSRVLLTSEDGKKHCVKF